MGWRMVKMTAVAGYRAGYLAGCLGCACALLYPFTVSAQDAQRAPVTTEQALCPPATEELLQTISIKRVVDGDTVHAMSGEKIRVIGINTPEILPRPQPLGHKAREVARRFLKEGERVAIAQGALDYNQHDRLLAHVYRITHDERIESLAAYLLRQGLGFSVAVPPNVQQWECLRDAEMDARQASRNLWKIPSSFVTTRPASGFALVRGTIVRLRRNKHGVTMLMNNGLNLYIPEEHLSHFNKTINRYMRKRVEVRGWMSRKNRDDDYRMRIGHPGMIEIR